MPNVLRLGGGQGGGAKVRGRQGGGMDRVRCCG